MLCPIVRLTELLNRLFLPALIMTRWTMFLLWRLVCLRVCPTFTLLHPTEVVVAFTAINGSKQEISLDSGEVTLEGGLRPNSKYVALCTMFRVSCCLSSILWLAILDICNVYADSLIHSPVFWRTHWSGEWTLVDKCSGLSMVNRFDHRQVSECLVHWGTGDLKMELWSDERPVSKETPLRICHQYEVTQTCEIETHS